MDGRRKKRQIDMRRLRGITRTWNGPGLNCFEFELTFISRRNAPESGELLIEFHIVPRVHRRVVAAGGIRLPNLQHRCSERLSLAVQNAAFDLDLFAFGLLAGHSTAGNSVEIMIFRRHDMMEEGSDGVGCCLFRHDQRSIGVAF